MTFVFLFTASAAFCPLDGNAASPSDDLAGRLGGSFESFVSAYGQPTELNPSIGEVFQVEGYGLVAAQFSRLAGPSDNETPALLVTISSPRGETVPATTLDDADWTVDDAASHIAAFAPADAQLTPLVEGGDGSLSGACTSASLSASFGQLGEGGCSIRAVQSAPGRISFITLSLVSALVPNDVATPVPACQGVAEWAQQSGARLNDAVELLNQLAAIDPATPTAGNDLANLQASFNQLASDQRAGTTPTEALTANFYLIGAYTGYASAIESAADGIAVSDQAALDTAANAIAAANVKIQRASAEIEQLVADCGLEIASPVAGD